MPACESEAVCSIAEINKGIIAIDKTLNDLDMRPPIIIQACLAKAAKTVVEQDSPVEAALELMSRTLATYVEEFQKLLLQKLQGETLQ